jgi:anaerobic selenocysteine-containing dehydrogenase
LSARTVRSYCRFCEALCGVLVTIDGDDVTKVRGDPDDPISHGYTCPKGRALGSWHHHPQRLDHPLIRRDEQLVEVSWDEMFDDLALRLRANVTTLGPDAIGLYSGTGSAFDASGRRIAERWLRLVGSRNRYSSGTIDAPCKPYVAELMSGHPGAVPAPDREEAGLLVLVGVNPVASHGHLNAFPDPVRSLRDLADRGGLWVIDPRRTESARLANGHLAPRPGTDYAAIAYLVRELLRDGASHDYLDRHATGVGRLVEAVEPFDLETAAQICDVATTDLGALLEAVRRHGKVACQTGTGVGMSASANVTEWMLWALQIVTESFDRPGGSWFHPGYLRSLDRRSLRPRSGDPDPGPPSRPDLPSRLGEFPVVAMYDEIEAGNLTALFVAGGNPMTAFPDLSRIDKALAGLDVLAVADVVETETTRVATHVIPVCGQLERADLPFFVDQFMPSVSTRYTPAVVSPGADRKPLWWFFATLGERMGLDVLGTGKRADETTDDDLLRELGDRSRAGDFDRLRFDRVVVDATPQVFGWIHEGLLPDGRWRIAPEPLVSQLEQMTHPEGTLLIPMRQLKHLNSQLTDGRGITNPDRPVLLIHPADAERLGVIDGGSVRVRSESGVVELGAVVDETVRPGSVAVPHGFSDPNLGDLTTTTSHVDPHTGMVLLSGLSVRIEPVMSV